MNVSCALAATTVKGFSPERLLPVLAQLPAVAHYQIAFSGGLDSHVLVHAMAQLRPALGSITLSAVYVDHGLQADSSLWAAHCATVCAALQIPFDITCVSLCLVSGASLEAAARQARYAGLTAGLKSGECLLTAHHQDDQAETLMLQLLRGAGPHGLAAMPVCTRLETGWHARPLLGFTQAELRAYAIQQGLVWVEDKTNLDTRFDRNYLRHQIMPQLRARWPAMARTLSRSARHAADAAQSLDVLAGSDLQAARGSVEGTLSIDSLGGLNPPRQRNLLRAWFVRLALPPPTATHIERILSEVVSAAPDALPLLSWPGVQVRRYRDMLHAMRPLPDHDAGQCLNWDIDQPIYIDGIGEMTALPVQGAGLRQSLCLSGNISVRFRQGGERCRPVGSRHTHELKKLFQECGIPPWQRDRIPLIYIGEQLAEVVNLWICEPFAAAPEEAGRHIRLRTSAGVSV